MTRKYLWLVLCAALLLFAACQKAPELTITSPASIELSADGSSGSITFTANRDWKVSSSDSWVTVSPSSGEASDKPVTVTVRCNANTTYDDRTATLTIRMEDLSQTVTVKQPANLGLMASDNTFEVSNTEQTVSLKVQANVQYDVIVDEACKSWISRVQTKGLTESSVSLLIAKNEGEERVGKVTLMSNGPSEEISIKQKSANIVFEDSEFRAYCVENFDKDGDGEVSLTEASLVQTISCWNRPVESFAGIESFKRLDTLSFGATHVKQLDASKIPSLNSLLCMNNEHLTSLDVSGCVELEFLWCTASPLGKLDVGGCSALKYLYCHNNQLENLDLSSCVSLETALCSDNKLMALNLSGSKSLKNLNCDRNLLTSLGTYECVALEGLSCKKNLLNNLDISNNQGLTTLDCSDNQITELILGGISGLKSISCSNNHLNRLDLTDCHAIEGLICNNNYITSLELQGLSTLNILNCAQNRLSVLDMASCSSLEELNCASNAISILILDNCSNLTHLYCAQNSLATLNVDGSLILEEINCSSNSISTLIIGNNTSLKNLNCSSNQLNTLDVSNCSSLENLYVRNNRLTHINVAGCGSISYINGGCNQLSSIDVHDCPELVSLDLYYNHLQSLDVSNNPLLNYLDCRLNFELSVIYLKTGQVIDNLQYSSNLTTIHYVD